ncbi:hypothetical protein G9A89_010584 [Geosiphon pyriformis]|nr:hypothetical protein G9A89_010584 [Geosiphon pyriformis]
MATSADIIRTKLTPLLAIYNPRIQKNLRETVDRFIGPCDDGQPRSNVFLGEELGQDEQLISLFRGFASKTMAIPQALSFIHPWLHQQSPIINSPNVLYDLTARKDYLDRLLEKQKEITKESDFDSEFTLEQLDRMVKLESFIKESMRCRGDILKHSKHFCESILSCFKKFITNSSPKIISRTIFVYLPSINADKDFQDPNGLEFNDYRYLNQNNPTTRVNQGFLEFSLCGHACPSRFFAILQTKTLNVTILRALNPRSFGEDGLKRIPPKALLESTELLDWMGIYARIANLGYCLEKNEIGKVVPGSQVEADAFLVNEEIMVFFKSPELSIEAWKQRKNTMVDYHPEFATNSPMKVDQVWYKNTLIFKNRLLQKIYSLIRKGNLDENEIPLSFTGHGIGGAYAVLTALEFAKEVIIGTKLHINIFIFTFGQPRIGNGGFSSFVNDVYPMYRITHTNDPVPQFPLVDDKGEKYYHHNTEYWIAHDCNCLETNTTIEYVVYKCPGYELERDDVREHPDCNSKQGGPEEDAIQAHYGSYFGTTMGDCKSMWQRWW